MLRRSLLAAAPALILGGRAAAATTLNIGYQKLSLSLVLARLKGALDARLKPLGYSVNWSEFTSGPPLLEALNAGAVDLGYTGEPPPIFAQAAGTPIVYVAGTDPSPRSIAIMRPAGSKLTSVKDLAGKSVAVGKGTSAHYLLVSALAAAGVPYAAVNKVFLQPADARAAFSSGSVDAWAIWDPFYAGVEATGAGRLTDGTNLMPNRAYYLARKPYAEANPAAIKAVIASLNELENWEKAHIPETAATVSPPIGLPPPVLQTWLDRLTYGVYPITPEMVAGQQVIADAFYKLALIPRAVTIADVVWHA